MCTKCGFTGDKLRDIQKIIDDAGLHKVLNAQMIVLMQHTMNARENEFALLKIKEVVLEKYRTDVVECTKLVHDDRLNEYERNAFRECIKHAKQKRNEILDLKI
jgi:hypothetical protein